MRKITVEFLWRLTSRKLTINALWKEMRQNASGENLGWGAHCFWWRIPMCDYQGAVSFVSMGFCAGEERFKEQNHRRGLISSNMVSFFSPNKLFWKIKGRHLWFHCNIEKKGRHLITNGHLAWEYSLTILQRW